MDLIFRKAVNLGVFRRLIIRVYGYLMWVEMWKVPLVGALVMLPYLVFEKVAVICFVFCGMFLLRVICQLAVFCRNVSQCLFCIFLFRWRFRRKVPRVASHCLVLLVCIFRMAGMI